MQDEAPEQASRRASVAPTVPVSGSVRTVPVPSSSRMFAAYLGDIERLLDAQRCEAALREALDLPRIAVALSEPQLRCTREQVEQWCEQWVRPPGAERDAHGLDHERLCHSIIERLTQSADIESVPVRALRRLQLRRHTRTMPRGFHGRRFAELPPREREAFEICTALIEAARRWYARSACHDPNVQANLARLVLR